MPRELVTLQVGQAGNQVACRFWELALHEHAAHSSLYGDAISTIFANVDARGQAIPLSSGPSLSPSCPIFSLRARAVLVDMEESVTAAILRGKLREIFSGPPVIAGSGGSGNNWAQGFVEHGPAKRDVILDAVRRQVEDCDSLQGFLMMHSLGGGTGSGVGSYLLTALADEYPEAYRISAPIFPSGDDDVVTSPYNALLAASKLVEAADCVVPLDNAALLRTVESTSATTTPVSSGGSKSTGGKPFTAMNTAAATALLGLTAPVRFPGSLNVDLGELATNLVPYPRLHFLSASCVPSTTNTSASTASAAVAARSSSSHVRASGASRTRELTADAMYRACLQPAHQLNSHVDPMRGTNLAVALLHRGDASLDDAERGVRYLRSKCRMVSWNPHGFKVGLCSVPPIGYERSLCMLSNNCSVHGGLTSLSDRFQMLWKRRSYAHHYTNYLSEADIEAAHETVVGVAEQYRAIHCKNENGGNEHDDDDGAMYRRRRRSLGLCFST